MTKITLTVSALLLIALISMSTMYVKQSKEVALQLSYISELQGTIVDLNQQIIDEIDENKRVVIEKESIASSFRLAKNELIKLKGRRVEDPEAVRIAVQKSYDTFVGDIQCITGDLLKCER